MKEKENNIKCCSCSSENVKTTHRTDEEKRSLKRRLNIIQGQINGISQMIDDERYCGDILMQLAAVNKALESLENKILDTHIRTCISREFKAGNDDITEEVMALFKRLR